jgi:carbon storage regulator
VLILSREVDEKIVIDESIIVTVVSIGRGRVRLGFEAAREIPIHRAEVHRKIMQALAANGVDDKP